MRTRTTIMTLAPIIALALSAPAIAQNVKGVKCPPNQECEAENARERRAADGDPRGRSERRAERSGREKRREREAAEASDKGPRGEADAQREQAGSEDEEKVAASSEERDPRAKRSRTEEGRRGGEKAADAPRKGEAKGDAKASNEGAKSKGKGKGKSEQTADAAEPKQKKSDAKASSGADDTVERQLEAQGDKEEAQRVRGLRDKLARQLQGAVTPTESGPARQDAGQERRGDERSAGRGGDDRDRADRDRAARRDRDERRFFDIEERDGRVVERRGARIILDLGEGRIAVRSNLPDEAGRLLFGARDTKVEPIRGGGARTIVYRRNGVQIVTERDRFGRIVLRKRVGPKGREFVLIDNRRIADRDRGRPRGPRGRYRDDRYIIDLGRASRRDIRVALLADPVEELDRRYTLAEVLRYEPVRAYTPRLDLDTITFDFGSATISDRQMDALAELGSVLEEVLRDNPEEVYLIEGYTDAVGSNFDNLILSDERAESVAVALSQNFDIPPENLVTKGYGEQDLKIDTQGPERRNRRVTVRRVTPLLARS